MSYLIDDIIYKDRFRDSQIYINGVTYIAKPMAPSWSFKRLKRRLKNTWLVLTGRAIAVHFKEDER